MKHVRSNSILGFCVPFCALHGTSDCATPTVGAKGHFLEHAAAPKEDQAVKRVGEAHHDLLGDPTAEEKPDFVLELVHK